MVVKEGGMGDLLLREEGKDGCARRNKDVRNSLACYTEAVLIAGSHLGWNDWDRILNRKVPSAILSGILRLGGEAEQSLQCPESWKPEQTQASFCDIPRDSLPILIRGMDLDGPACSCKLAGTTEQNS